MPAKLTDKGFKPGCTVSCPCCHAAFDTDDHVPFDFKRSNLYHAAPELFQALRNLLSCVEAEHDEDYARTCAIEAPDHCAVCLARSIIARIEEN